MIHRKYAMLFAAINEGDRTALHPLADMMLEDGDPIGKGMIWLIEHDKWPMYNWDGGGAYDWFPLGNNWWTVPTHAQLELAIIRHLKSPSHPSWAFHYDKCSQAIMAAAEGSTRYLAKLEEVARG